jgi:surface antigen
LLIRIKKTAVWLKGKERITIEYIKHNRVKTLLDFFRKNSAVSMVFFLATLIVVGNIGFKKEQGGFLFGSSGEPTDNKEKIKHRVKSHAFKGNLTMAPLAVASDLKDEGDIRSLTLKDDQQNQNQMQHQVLTASTPPDAKELLAEGADVAVYKVQDGDTVGSIAKSFGITANTILWANDLDDPDMIQPGDTIFVLPTSGVKHVVKGGDNLDKIAKEYEVDKKEIIAFNDLPADGKIEKGDELIIPGGEIEEEEPAQDVLRQRDYYGSQVADEVGTSPAKRTPSIIDKNPKGGHSFPYGYCTWYVASRKHVPWGGNAGTWLYNARAYGVKTGKKAKAGAIIVTSESWYGHVGIVTKVSGSKVTIKEMNYRGWGKVSSRTISAGSRVIKGYIY